MTHRHSVQLEDNDTQAQQPPVLVDMLAEYIHRGPPHLLLVCA